MQPYIFPYIGYFQLINAVEKFIILDDVNFINRGWINRNKIINNGREYLFTIPLKKKSQNKLINTLYISDDYIWKKKFLKTLENSYKKAMFYDDVIELITRIIKYDEKNLSKYIYNSIVEVCSFLNIETKYVETSAIYPKKTLKSEKRIIDICLIEKAENYINPIGGQDIYNKENFCKNNIELFFLKTNKIDYKQFTNNFIPSLSIIDVMMFNGKEEIKKMLNNYELI